MPGRHHDDRAVEILDTGALLRLRLGAHLSRRALAAKVGVSETTIRNLELGRNHSTTTLDLIERIASAFDVSIVRLFFADRTGAPASDDDAVLESVLLEATGFLSVSSIAAGLGWDHQRTRSAIAALDTRTRGTGQQLVLDTWGKVRLRPTPRLTDRQRIDTARAASRERGLTLAALRVLRLFLEGELTGTWLQNASRSNRAALSFLLGQGVLTTRTEIGDDGPDRLQIILAPEFHYLRLFEHRTTDDGSTETSVTIHSEQFSGVDVVGSVDRHASFSDRPEAPMLVRTGAGRPRW